MNFCTAINCIDGRVQIPIIRFLQNRFNIEYVDLITEAGPVRFFADQNYPTVLDAIMKRVDISVQAHESLKIAVCCHADCAGNPVDEDTQQKQLKVAVDYIKERFPTCTIIGLWIDPDWQVHEMY